MQLLLLIVYCLFFEFRNSVASENLFSTFDNINENPVDGLDFEPLALGESGDIAQPADVLDFDSNFTPNTNMWSLSDDLPISFDTSGNLGESTDLIASGCPASDKLGKRNEPTTCPNPDGEKIGIPTFEEMMGAVEVLHKTLEDKICSPPRLFHLCCICGGFNNFGLCDFCEQCKFAFLDPRQRLVLAVFIWLVRLPERDSARDIFEQERLLKYEGRQCVDWMLCPLHSSVLQNIRPLLAGEYS